jgi:predicted nucleic acid-binding protein
MVLVDTSIWINFFKGIETNETLTLENLIEAEESISYSGIILQELFQGVNSTKQRNLIDDFFSPFLELFPQKSTYLLAARIFRESRSNGHPIRSSIDCLIAALAIENNCKLLYRDRDFGYIAEVSKLRVIKSNQPGDDNSE